MNDSTRTPPAVFNNAGVLLLAAGKIEVAQDMFRAAVEQISVDHNSIQQGSHFQENEHRFDNNNGNSDNGGRDTTERPVAPECVTVAEKHLTRLDSYLSNDNTESSVSTEEMAAPETETLPGVSVFTCQEDVEYQDDEERRAIQEPSNIFRNHNNLLVYSLPFELQHESSENRSTELNSAIIVFNLALSHSLVVVEEKLDQAHHCFVDDVHSPKIGAFYNIVDRLLSKSQAPVGHDLATDLLRIALWNNMSIWCHENGLLEERTMYLQSLLQVFEHWHSQLSPTAMQGLRWNLWSLLTLPPESYYTTTVSPSEDQEY